MHGANDFEQNNDYTSMLEMRRGPVSFQVERRALIREDEGPKGPRRIVIGYHLGTETQESGITRIRYADWSLKGIDLSLGFLRGFIMPSSSGGLLPGTHEIILFAPLTVDPSGKISGTRYAERHFTPGEINAA